MSTELATLPGELRLPFMASPVEAFDLVSARKEQLRKVFTEFEAKKFSLGRIGATWKDIEEHFKEIETCLEKTHEAYRAKERSFEAKMKSDQEELDKRAANVSVKEQASVRRVQSLKDAAIAEIREQKRKLADDKRTWEAEKQRAVSAVTQPKKNASTAKASISKDLNPKKKADAIPKSSKVALVTKPESTAMSAGNKKEVSPKQASTEVEKVPANSKGDEKDDENLSSFELFRRIPKEARLRLQSVCQNMDYDGFKKLIIENQRELKSLQADFRSALKLCNDPAELVLKTIEGYLDVQKKGKLNFGKDDCYVCTMLSDCLLELHRDIPTVSVKVRQAAKDLGDRWKALLKLDGQFGFNMVLVGRSFLQFIAAFDLSSEYDQDELCDVVAKVARRKQTPKVFRMLKLSEKAPEVIERLIKDGKVIEAVYFTAEFNLLERFPPAPLLKAHIKDAKKAVKNILKAGGKSSAAQNEAVQKEVAALKAIADVVKEYKLEGHYTLDYVEKQLANLEKTKADRKRAPTAVAKAQEPKKSRMDDGSPSRSPQKPLHGRQDRELYDGGRMPPYGAAGLPGLVDRRHLGEFDRRPLGDLERRGLEEYRRPLEDFDRRRLGMLDPAYGASSANSMIHGSYGHPSLDIPSLAFRSSAQGGQQPSSMGGYEYSSALSSLGMGGFGPYR